MRGSDAVQRGAGQNFGTLKTGILATAHSVPLSVECDIKTTRSIVRNGEQRPDAQKPRRGRLVLGKDRTMAKARTEKIERHLEGGAGGGHTMLAPSPSLLCKLGSIAVHIDEMFSADGHAFDRVALQALLADAEVVAWIKLMDAASMVPRKRKI